MYCNQFILTNSINCVASGPDCKGNEEFDKQCIYGNEMFLDEEQVQFLHNWCDDVAPKIKYFVYKMTPSSVVSKKCKMVRKSLLFILHLLCQRR